MFSKMLLCSIQWNWMVTTAVKSSKCWQNFWFFGWTSVLSLVYSFLLPSSLFISILFIFIFVWLALYPLFLVRWLRRNRERGQREVPARPGTMKRFRRHAHESQRDKHKQDLYQFNKVVHIFCRKFVLLLHTHTQVLFFSSLSYFIYSLFSVVS